MVELTLIVAATATNGIGQGGTMPWNLPRDLKYFGKVTSAAPEGTMNAVVMGRKTWESIPKKNRPLKGRYNVIISRQVDYDTGVPPTSPTPSTLQSSFDSALASLSNDSAHKINRAFLIGGATLFDKSFHLSETKRVLMTRILSPAYEDCDVHMLDFTKSGEWVQSSHEELEKWVGFEVAKGEQQENGSTYEFQMWVKKDAESA